MAESVIEVTDKETLEALIENSYAVVVKFTAPSWCVPCRQFAPHFASVAQTSSFSSDMMGRVDFVSVDIDDAPWATEVYGVRGVPTVMLYVQGTYVVNLQERSAVKFGAEIKSHLT